MFSICLPNIGIQVVISLDMIRLEKEAVRRIDPKIGILDGIDSEEHSIKIGYGKVFFGHMLDIVKFNIFIHVFFRVFF